ncbi:hypothetical protein SSS_00353 [Sarcoptes scabiei]|uniref:Uncharacterized protein n=1 Tax=Sarcoptes scabiei TaxID=52283 RepID=A0A834RCI8_SARSC|nr:hypothetical protein SSS_00353 [Sarcoptes scabiei]
MRNISSILFLIIIIDSTVWTNPSRKQSDSFRSYHLRAQPTIASTRLIPSSSSTFVRSLKIPASNSFTPTIKIAAQNRKVLEYLHYDDESIRIDRSPQTIEIDTETAPIQLIFRTKSGPLMFKQIHSPSLRSHHFDHQKSTEPVQILTHEIFKPILQELREIIQPFRKITQEIRPVLEEARTIVSNSSSTKRSNETEDFVAIQSNQNESNLSANIESKEWMEIDFA